MNDDRRWHKDQLVLHGITGRGGYVQGIDFEEQMVEVRWIDQDEPPTWARMENLIQTGADA